MALPIPSQPNLPTPSQNPANSILDQFNRQTYLGNAYSFPIGPQTVNSTAETPIGLIVNPLTSGGAQNLKALFNNLRTTASDNASGDGTSFFRYYINPTIAALGTQTIPVNCRPASNLTSVSNCYVSGQFTVSANGTLWRSIMAGYSAIDDSALLLVLDPGQSLLITVECVTSGSQIINASSFYEI
jgi:hypothetical protein